MQHIVYYYLFLELLRRQEELRRIEEDMRRQDMDIRSRQEASIRGREQQFDMGPPPGRPMHR